MSPVLSKNSMASQRYQFISLVVIVIVVGISCLSAAVALAAQNMRDDAANYPARPIRILVPFPAGGGSDITARIIAERLSESLRQQIIVDNRPGAGGNVAGAIAAKAPADGQTLYAITASTAVNVAIYKSLAYDLVRDFAPIVQISALPYTLAINASASVNSVKELLAQARAKPGSISYGSNGLGGLSHVSGELLAALSKTRMLHVPYKGGAQALTDVMSGQITFLFATPLLSGPHVRGGKIKILAVTSAKRSNALPDAPTLSESGVPGYEVTSWNGLLAPVATSPSIIAKLNSTVNRVLGIDRDRLSKDGSDVIGGAPSEFGAVVSADIVKWKRLAREIGLSEQ
jgi:tripartite-type tricarboxylate transporter receptor subunit TctC